MRRWQYKVVQQKILLGQGGSDGDEDRNREAMLDRYGREGWELISVVQQSYRREYDPTAMQGYSFFSYYFKREEPSTPAGHKP
jgi:hypothetical protein